MPSHFGCQGREKGQTSVFRTGIKIYTGVVGPGR